MKNAVQKWGNSLGLRIPAAIAEELHIKRGTPVVLRLDDGALVVRVARPRRKRNTPVKLRELIARMTPGAIEPTYDWGPDQGSEIIK